MIKIITGWSNPGGSTTAFINLCNAFNDRGIECKMYGPHQWFADKCSSDHISKASVQSNDHVISHFCILNMKNKPKSHILSLHEKELFTLDKVQIANYSHFHFVSENQKGWHKPPVNSFVCPNVIDKLVETPLPKTEVAGIIGSIDRNKRTHISVRRAVESGIKDVRIFGNVTDQSYFDGTLIPLIQKLKDQANIKLMGYCDDKQSIYNQITDVYLSSASETWSYIKVEAEATGRSFYGTDAISGNHSMSLTEDEIVNVWKEKLGV